MVKSLLTRKEGNLALSPPQLAIGSYMAAIFGRQRVLHKLLNEQLDREASLHSTSVIQNALIGAAGHGHITIVKTLIDTPRFKDSISNPVMNSAIIAATESGNLDVVDLCLQEGANAVATVQKRARTGHLGTDGAVVFETFTKDFSYLDNDDVRSWLSWNTRLETNELSYRGLAGLSPSLRQRLITNLSSDATTALRAALLGLQRIRCADSIPGLGNEGVSDKERHQEALVSLMLDQGCEPSSPDGCVGNERVVEQILQALVFDDDDDNEQEDSGSGDKSKGSHKPDRQKLVLLATKRDSAIGFRVMLRLLQAGTAVPATPDGVLRPEIITILGKALNLMRHPNDTGGDGVWDLIFAEKHPYTADQARRFMNSGIRTLIKLVFARLPRQRATHRIFHEFLAIAATAGDIQIVKLLIKKEGREQIGVMPPSYSALGGAAQFGHLQVMEVLLGAGELPNGRAPSTEGGSPLSRAIRGGHIPAVKLLIEQGADLNTQGNPILLLALDCKDRDMFEFVLAAESEILPHSSVLVTACADGDVDLVSK
ncbi:unnamed protein product [Penicillium glandicola]